MFTKTAGNALNNGCGKSLFVENHGAQTSAGHSSFYHGPRRYDGRDQHVAILLLLQSSNGPIRAEQITKYSSVIGQYD